MSASFLQQLLITLCDWIKLCISWLRKTNICKFWQSTSKFQQINCFFGKNQPSFAYFQTLNQRPCWYSSTKRLWSKKSFLARSQWSNTENFLVHLVAVDSIWVPINLLCVSNLHALDFETLESLSHGVYYCVFCWRKLHKADVVYDWAFPDYRTTHMEHKSSSLRPSRLAEKSENSWLLRESWVCVTTDHLQSWNKQTD